MGALRFGALELGGFAVEGGEDDVEAVALGGDETDLLARVAEVGWDQGPRIGEILAGRATCARIRRCARRSCNSTGQQVIEIRAGVTGPGPLRSRNTKSREERLRIALGFGRRRRGIGRWHAEDLGLEGLNGELQVGDSGGSETVVGACDELVDLGFILFKPRVDLLFVDDARTLGLGEDEVEEEEEANVSVKGNPDRS